MCPHCDKQILWYDNIPVLSYLMLKGRCRHCRTPISFRYVCVEILGGLAALCVFLRFGLSTAAVAHYAFLASLIVITIIDIDHRIIPDIISLPGIPVFFIASLFLPGITYKDSALGILAGGGSLFLVAWVYHLITKKEGMGGGDIKLLAMIGALVGWKGVLFTIFVASTVGTVAGILIMLVTKKNMKLALPFGPFLAIGATTYIFFGSRLIYWYVNILK